MTTKKEFIAKIAKVGKGEPIDTSNFYDLPQSAEWSNLHTGSIVLWDPPNHVVIDHLDRTNPPQHESNITFRHTNGGSHEVETVPGAFANKAAKKLYEPPEAGLSVVLPETLKQALYSLQSDEQGIEWGGGIDFETIKGKPQIERVLAYLGCRRTMGVRAFAKYIDDVEVQFHTHPEHGYAMPSPNDIRSFLGSPQQLSMIVASDEIIVLQKTRNTPGTCTVEEADMLLPLYNSDEDDETVRIEIQKLIEKEFWIRSTVIPRDKPVILDITAI